MNNNESNNPVAFITGASVRIGAAIAKRLHQEGFNLILHYRNSKDSAQALANEFNQLRANSVQLLSGHLDNSDDCQNIIQNITAVDGPFSGRLDVLVNNASAFYPTAVEEAKPEQWDELINTNLRAPFLLSQGLTRTLSTHSGCIINITDIHGAKPLKDHSIYSVSKAGLISLTLSLAKELAPSVRTNAISPGAILWPSKDEDDLEFQKEILAQVPLDRLGAVENISDTVWFLVNNDYINGQIINVDGGKSIT